MSKQEAHRREVAEVLAYAPVPVAASDFLKTQFKATRRTEDFDLGFKVLAHLLANGGEHAIPQVAFEAMGASGNHSTLAKQVNRQVDAGVIEVVRAASWQDDNKSGRLFRIPGNLLDLMLDAEDGRTHAKPNDAWTRNYHRSKPSTTLDDSFKVLADREPDLAAAVLRLQARSIGFDRLGLLSWLRANRQQMDEADARKQLSLALMLCDGDNFSRYRLAKSGRVLSFGPNLQGIPRVMRGPWFFPQPGFQWLDFDFKTQESWIVAYLSGDEALLVVLRDHDLYRLIADEFGLDRDSQVKPMLNAYNYGAGTATLARLAFGRAAWETPMQDEIGAVREFEALMRDKFPVAGRWTRGITREVQRTGQASSVGGFIRTGISRADARRVGVNHVVQASGADVLRAILQTLDRDLGVSGRVILPMHDGLLVEAADDKVSFVVEIVKQAMRNATLKFLPGTIPIEMLIGWRDKRGKAATWNQRPARFDGNDQAAA